MMWILYTLIFVVWLAVGVWVLTQAFERNKDHMRNRILPPLNLFEWIAIIPLLFVTLVFAVVGAILDPY